MKQQNSKRIPSNKLIEYQKEVKEREQNISSVGLCFTNDFDQSFSIRKSLEEIIPDIYSILLPQEIDGIIDCVYDKTCEDLRNKGLLSKESRNLLCR